MGPRGLSQWPALLSDWRKSGWATTAATGTSLGRVALPTLWTRLLPMKDLGRGQVTSRCGCWRAFPAALQAAGVWCSPQLEPGKSRKNEIRTDRLLKGLAGVGNTSLSYHEKQTKAAMYSKIIAMRVGESWRTALNFSASVSSACSKFIT